VTLHPGDVCDFRASILSVSAAIYQRPITHALGDATTASGKPGLDPYIARGFKLPEDRGRVAVLTLNCLIWPSIVLVNLRSCPYACVYFFSVSMVARRSVPTFG